MKTLEETYSKKSLGLFSQYVRRHFDYDDVITDKSSFDNDFIDVPLVDDVNDLDGLVLKTVLDEDYPTTLLKTFARTLVLVCKGNMSLLNEPFENKVALYIENEVTPSNLTRFMKFTDTLSDEKKYVFFHHGDLGSDYALRAVLDVVTKDLVVVVPYGLKSKTVDEDDVREDMFDEVIDNNGLIISTSSPKDDGNYFTRESAMEVFLGLGEAVIFSSISNEKDLTKKTLEWAFITGKIPFTLNRDKGICEFSDKNNIVLDKLFFIDNFQKAVRIIKEAYLQLEALSDEND